MLLIFTIREIAEVPENVSDNGSAVVEVAGEPLPTVPTMPSLVLGLGTPVDMNVVALYTFNGTSLGQLPFNKGDIIRVTENQVYESFILPHIFNFFSK